MSGAREVFVCAKCSSWSDKTAEIPAVPISTADFNNGIQLQEFNITPNAGFVVLCLKGFACSSWVVSNESVCSNFVDYKVLRYCSI